MAYALQNGPAGDKNAYQRSIIRIIRPINGSFVGRMLLRPTWGHENAVRFVYSKAWHALKAAYFSGNAAEHTPSVIIFRPSG